MARIAIEAEALGFGYLTLSDHVLIPRDIRAPYPYSETGAFPLLQNDDLQEQLTAIAWLAGQTWLLREHGSGTRATTEAFLEELQIAPATLTVGSNVAVGESVAAGLGVTLISRDAVARELRHGVLAELPVPGTPLRRDWCLVSRAGRLPAPSRLFVQHVRQAEGWAAGR